MEQFNNSINWVEIPVADFDRAKRFYSAIYDYDMPEIMMGDYRMGFFICEREGEHVGAAIVAGEGYEPSKQGTRAYLNGGSDLNIVLNRIEKAGGKITQPKTLITEEIGYYAAFIDTEGNLVSLHSMK